MGFGRIKQQASRGPYPGRGGYKMQEKKTRTVKIVVSDQEWNRFKIEALTQDKTVQELMSKIVIQIQRLYPLS